MPLSGYARVDASRPVLNENTRVMSDSNASTWMSNMSFMCSANESGTPNGASGSSRGSPLAFFASTAWILRSSSRMSARYLSIRWRSVGPRSRLSPARSPTIQSRMLWLAFLLTARSALLLPAPNSASNAIRGLRIMGSGSVGLAQLSVSVYAQA